MVNDVGGKDEVEGEGSLFVIRGGFLGFCGLGGGFLTSIGTTGLSQDVSSVS